MSKLLRSSAASLLLVSVLLNSPERRRRPIPKAGMLERLPSPIDPVGDHLPVADGVEMLASGAGDRSFRTLERRVLHKAQPTGLRIAREYDDGVAGGDESVSIIRAHRHRLGKDHPFDPALAVALHLDEIERAGVGVTA